MFQEDFLFLSKVILTLTAPTTLLICMYLSLVLKHPIPIETAIIFILFIMTLESAIFNLVINH